MISYIHLIAYPAFDDIVPIVNTSKNGQFKQLQNNI